MDYEKQTIDRMRLERIKAYIEEYTDRIHCVYAGEDKIERTVEKVIETKRTQRNKQVINSKL